MTFSLMMNIFALPAMGALGSFARRKLSLSGMASEIQQLGELADRTERYGDQNFIYQVRAKQVRVLIRYQNIHINAGPLLNAISMVFFLAALISVTASLSGLISEFQGRDATIQAWVASATVAGVAISGFVLLWLDKKPSRDAEVDVEITKRIISGRCSMSDIINAKVRKEVRNDLENARKCQRPQNGKSCE